MTILDYYLNMQQNKNWVNKFVSTSSNQSGKIFSYVNTNFRGVYSFFEQVLKFNKKNALPRSEWNDKQNKGQEKDKHRVINLIRAGFFEFEQTDLSYIITPKGQTILDIKDEKLNKEEIWLLLYLLLIDYKNEENNFDILNSTKKLFIDLEGYGYSREKIINLIREGIKSKDKKELFMKDIFWLITFQKDDNFLDCFSKSKSEDITSLKWHVIKDNEMNNEDDCIVHKFINGGVYTVSTFKDDLKVLYWEKPVIKEALPK